MEKEKRGAVSVPGEDPTGEGGSPHTVLFLVASNI